MKRAQDWEAKRLKDKANGQHYFNFPWGSMIAQYQNKLDEVLAIAKQRYPNARL